MKNTFLWSVIVLLLVFSLPEINRNVGACDYMGCRGSVANSHCANDGCTGEFKLTCRWGFEWCGDGYQFYQACCDDNWDGLCDQCNIMPEVHK